MGILVDIFLNYFSIISKSKLLDVINLAPPTSQAKKYKINIIWIKIFR